MLEINKDKFIKDAIGDYDCAEKLTGDASNRVYYRIFKENNTYILCEDSQFKNTLNKDYSFYIVHNLFQQNRIPVPGIIELSIESGLLLIQDLGDGLLETVYDDLSVDSQKSIYMRLIDILVNIQGIVNKSNLPPFSLSFDIDKLMFEFNFFITHGLISYFNPNILKNEIEELTNEFQNISSILYKPEYFVLNHRDYISRNIIVYDGDPYIIDFQDARLGLPQYDLVSLLRDSCPRLDNELFKFLKKYYYEKAFEAGVLTMDEEEFEYYFDIMSFQRNIKILGTFTYQSGKFNRKRYEKYIKPVIDYLSDYAGRRSILRKAFDIVMYNISSGPSQ